MESGCRTAVFCSALLPILHKNTDRRMAASHTSRLLKKVVVDVFGKSVSLMAFC